jgi:hypothetical protein
VKTQLWADVNELMWEIDFLGVSDDRRFTPGEYDALTDRIVSVLVNHGDAAEAVSQLDRLLRREWGSQVPRSGRTALESRIEGIAKRGLDAS